MLILPLHRPLTAETFPFATAVLVLLNVFVFFVFQLNDGPAMARAQAQYEQDDLARYEVPAYEKYLEQGGRRAELAELRALDAEVRGAYVAQSTLTDVTFVQRLQKGELFENASDFQAWQPLRRRYDDLQQDVFTLRHLMRSSEVDLWRMFAATFLHGGILHLIGNMLFLAALGLLVEGTLGPLRFTVLYVLGALGSSAASLAWRWGEAGGGLGASGAIAALMGAFCLIWGRQPVRFFYWIGVVFNYVRAPAIWLFPAWLGWEIYNLFANPDIGVGFDAHAGGLLSGALLGAIAVVTRQVRTDFILEPEATAQSDLRWEQAQSHLGKLELTKADALLQELQAEEPKRFDVALARYRVAQNGANRLALRDRVRDLLQLPALDAATANLQADILAKQGDLDLTGAQRVALARRWMQLGAVDPAEVALSRADSQGTTDADVAQAWLELGLLRHERRETEASQRALREILIRFPEQPQAQKARFLLDNA